MNWHPCRDDQQWRNAALEWLQNSIHKQLNHHNPVTLALCGGETPWPLFQQAIAENRWPWQQLRLVPTDERWVPLDSERSNEGRLHRLFGATQVNIAGFRSLADTPEAAVAHWNKTPPQALPHIALLGMGADGHFASIFTDADFAQEDNAFLTEHNGELRISWSRKTLEQVPELAVFIRGQAKKDVLDQNIGVIPKLLKLRPDTQIFWVPES